MTVPIGFHNDLTNYLQLSLESIRPEPQDDIVNVGEDFDVIFAVRNTAPGGIFPRIRFQRPRLQVRPGDYAVLRSGNWQETLDFNRDQLDPGEIAFVTVELHATNNIGIALFPGGPVIPGTDAPFLLESVLKARHFADFDWVRFARVVGLWTTYYHDIEPD